MNIKSIIFISTIFLSANNLSAKDYTVEELVNIAWDKSPLLKEAQREKDIINTAKELTEAYHMPILSFSQSLERSNNPVKVFSYKLMQEDFKMPDFSINSLNNPDLRNQNLSAFTLILPLYSGNQITQQSKSLKDKVEFMDYQKNWIKKIVRRNIYGLFYAYYYMDELEQFLTSEKKYLDSILDSYDAKTLNNKNRYLSYNQGRIIEESIMEGRDEITANKKAIIAQIEFISGVSDINLDMSSKDIFMDLKWNQLDENANVEREDIRAMEKYADSLKKEIAVSKAVYLPHLNGFANYNFSSEEFDNYGEDYTLGLEVGWNFGLSSFKSVLLADKKESAAREKYFTLINQAKKEVKELKSDLEGLKQKLGRYENKDILFRENKKILTSQYKQGSIDLYNLLDNFAHYIQNKSELQQMKASFKMKLATYLDNFSKL
ncbi:MAG: TolC family protein [bacterium]